MPGVLDLLELASDAWEAVSCKLDKNDKSECTLLPEVLLNESAVKIFQTNVEPSVNCFSSNLDFSH